MEAILRVHGKKMDISGVLSLIPLRPYRIDQDGIGRAKTNCLHYDVVPSEDIDFARLLVKAATFLEDNEEPLLRIKERSDVEGVVLDIGVTIAIDVFSSTYNLAPLFLARLAQLGLSVEISVYKESGRKGA
jgi:hypothetical protein